MITSPFIPDNRPALVTRSMECDCFGKLGEMVDPRICRKMCGNCDDCVIASAILDLNAYLTLWKSDSKVDLTRRFNALGVTQ